MKLQMECNMTIDVCDAQMGSFFVVQGSQMNRWLFGGRFKVLLTAYTQYISGLMRLQIEGTAC